jgi:hypothetical protein
MTKEKQYTKKSDLKEEEVLEFNYKTPIPKPQVCNTCGKHPVLIVGQCYECFIYDW